MVRTRYFSMPIFFFSLVIVHYSTACRSSSGSNNEQSPCARIEVEPSADATASLVNALERARTEPIQGLIGPAGKQQGRVYLAPGEYGLGQINMVSNVRIEIAPGATLHPLNGMNPKPNDDWGVFIFGDADIPVSNISIVAGDGCGGEGIATSTNKPTNTNFRGNNPTVDGMANADVPFRPEWRTDRMWVLDIDPAAYKIGVQVTGMHFRWAYDVEIRDVFTIQNPLRTATGIGLIAGATSRTTAMMFDPPDDAPFNPITNLQKIPQRISVQRHYNILSPSGQGPNQIRACRDCSFREIFSHGGVALRVETDGIRPKGANCMNTGANGFGFREFAIVTGLTAERIEAAFANRTVMFTPHCLPNGTAKVNDVRGTSVGELVKVDDTESPAPNGSFETIEISNVWGCGAAGASAQKPYPLLDSYLPDPPRNAVEVDSTVTWVRPGGTWSWPLPGTPTIGLQYGNFPVGQTTEFRQASTCP